jgi:glycosyltransferase involved in cell wall biosynthesis
MQRIKKMLREKNKERITKECKNWVKDLSAASSKKDMMSELTAILAKRGKAAKKSEGGSEPKANQEQEKLQTAGYERAQRFSWEQSARDIIDFINEKMNYSTIS